MSITIGSFSTTRLRAQPYGYEEASTRDGLTAQRWRIAGLLTEDEWQDLLDEFASWRDDRIADPDSLAANNVGTTVDFSGTANGITWTDVPCWFTSAPSGEQVGAYIDAVVELVDAEQALEVALRQKEKAKSAEDRPDLGTYTVGTTELTLLRPPETWTDAPTIARAVSGTSYITGPLGATRVLSIEGTTDASGWVDIQSWYETTISSTPAAGDWFPSTPPSAVAENRVIDGLKVVEYTVTLALAQVL
jgi:hypothetical protein